jgi:hypothetical protein
MLGSEILFFHDYLEEKKNHSKRKIKHGDFGGPYLGHNKIHLGGDPVIKASDQKVCSFDGLRFEPCDCSYDSHWRLTWSLTSRPVGLVEVHAN